MWQMFKRDPKGWDTIVFEQEQQVPASGGLLRLPNPKP